MAVGDLVQQCEASSMPTMLKLGPLLCFQYLLHARGVVVPVKREVSSSALDHFSLGDAVFGVGIPNTAGLLKDSPDCFVCFFPDLS